MNLLENYEYRHEDTNREYTINYAQIPEEIEGADTPYKARLITAQEIATITGADKKINWDEIKSGIYYQFDSLEEWNSTWSRAYCESNTCLYGWLTDRTSSVCSRYDCLNEADDGNGYWTATLVANNTYMAWYITSTSTIESCYIKKDNYGIRPVIEVYKSKLK